MSLYTSPDNSGYANAEREMMDIDDALPVIPLLDDLDPEKFLMPDGLVASRPTGQEYVCLLCGERYKGSGCIPAIEKHLKTEHDAIPEGKILWVCFQAPSEVMRERNAKPR